jgi:hypothetical protein
MKNIIASLWIWYTNLHTCSSNEMTRVWTFSSVKWATSLAKASDNFVKCEQKSDSNCLEMTRLTFSLTTEINK